MTDPNDTGIPDPEASAEATESTTRRRIVWGYVGGAALLVIAALLAWWAVANSSTGTPPSGSPDSASPAASASATASGEPTASDEPADSGTEAADESPDAATEPLAPGATAPVIEAFSPLVSEVACASDRSSEMPLDFSWRTSGADQAWIAAGTTDASALPFAEVPTAAGSYAALTFTCLEDEQLYTLTVRGEGGTTSSSVVVTRSQQ